MTQRESNVYLVHGMKRSGNHAIIDWIRSHDTFIFFNDIVDLETILRDQKNIPEKINFKSWLQAKAFKKTVKDRNLYPLYKCLFAKRRNIILSLEDHDIQYKPFVNLPDHTRNVLVLRDPVNLFASRIKKASFRDCPEIYPRGYNSEMRKVLEKWKGHALEFLNSTHHLEQKICVSFNSWFEDRIYRDDLSARLGFSQPPTTTNLMVTRRGGGSSFDGVEFDGRADAMNITGRYGDLSNSEKDVLNEIFKDRELQSLHQQLNGNGKFCK